MITTISNRQSRDYVITGSLVSRVLRKLLIVFFVHICSSGFTRTFYVNSNIASGANNGSSWINAFINLQRAVDSSSVGDTIKLAGGTYRPPGTTSSASFTFKGGIVLLGGYSPATGDSTDALRNWVNYPVILNAVLPNNVVAGTLIKAIGFTSSCVMDGFIVRGSQYEGLLIQNSNSLIILNSIFENNAAETISNENSTVSFTNCVFRNNEMFAQCINNFSNSVAGFYNCIFTGNGFTSYGQRLIANINSVVTFLNCTLANNRSLAIYGSGSGSSTIRNSIFWDNRTSGNVVEGADINPTNQLLLISDCITQTYLDAAVTTLYPMRNPRFLNVLNPAGPDNKFYTADDGLQLTVPCSPAVNMGNNSYAASLTSDILGQPRIFNGGLIDLGAYETQAVPGSHFQTTYVRGTASPGGDGSSWQNAFTTLQAALYYCSDTIKVAAGTYLTTNSSKDSVFVMETGGVIKGGYPATGNPTDADRNPDIYPTILKGNFPVDLQRPPVMKSYHNDSTTVIDGLAFSNDANYTSSGNSTSFLIDYSSRIRVIKCNFSFAPALGLNSGGMTISRNSSPLIQSSKFSVSMGQKGGTCLISGSSSPKIKQSSFIGYADNEPKTNNAASFSGGSPVLDTCIFWTNFSAYQGSLVSTSSTNLVVTGCVFRGRNQDHSYAMANLNSPNVVINNSTFKHIGNFTNTAVRNDNSSPIFNYCLFDSSALNIDNANRSFPVFNNCVSIYGKFMKSKLSAPTLNNCTIVNTSSAVSEEEAIINDDSTTLRANNCIFWSFRLAPGKQDILNQNTSGNGSHTSGSILTNCMTQVYGTNGLNGNQVGINPRFYSLTDLDGPDNIMFTADDGLRLAKCSPAINSGNNSAVVLLVTDILKQPRIYNATVDIGAYELQENPGAPKSYYVNANASGNNSGSSWADAYNNLQLAVCNSCADTIRVAAGTYTPAVTNRDSTFYFDRPFVLWGGYPNSGNPGDQLRDPVNNVTTLSGQIGNTLDSIDNTQNILTIVGIRDSAIIDGFTIRDAQGSSGIGINAIGGGGLGLYYNKTNISNCQFINNRSFPSGGAIYVSKRVYSRMSNCVFLNNSATNFGGGVFFDGDSLKMTNCVFEGNRSYTDGGGMKIINGNFDVNNTVFYRNYTTTTIINTGQGGGVWARGATVGTFTNCTFLENYTNAVGAQGGGLFTNSDLIVRIRNTIFKGNALVGNNTMSEGSDFDWGSHYNVVFNCVMQMPRQTLSSVRFTPANFIDSLHPRGADNRWLTADDGLRLNYTSTAINFGNNSYVTRPTDIIGNNRIVSDTVDAGAYEYQNLPVANAGSDTSICSGGSAQIGKPANPLHNYSWTSSPAGFTSNAATVIVSPSVITTYFLEVSNGTVIAKDTVVVTPSASITPLVSISTPLTAICQGSNVLFVATPVNQGTTPSYQWMINGANAGANSDTFSTSALANGSQVKVIMTSSAGCAAPVSVTSNTITITVNPTLVPSVSISTPTTTICNGTNVTFSATSVNTGTLPYYTWVKGGLVVQTGLLNNYTTNSILDNDQVWVVLTSNAVCASPAVVQSNKITMTLGSSSAPFVTIVASANNVCSSTNISFTASPLNTGPAPTYQWKKNNVNVGTDSIKYTTNTLLNGDIVQVEMTTTGTCATNPVATSNAITMSLTNSVTPAVSIAASSNPICAGTNVTFTATPVNGGNLPYFQWKLNGANVGFTNTTYSNNNLADGDIVSVRMTSNATCANPIGANSNAVTMTVNSVNQVASVTISGNTTVQQGQQTTLTTVTTNAGTTPTYQWQDSTQAHSWQNIAGANASTIAYTPAATDDKLRCNVTVSNPCVNPTNITSNVLIFIVSPATGVPTIPGSAYGIRLFPNPVSSSFTIDTLKLSDKWQLAEIITMDGKHKLFTKDISNQTNVTINVAGLPDGLYLVVLKRRAGKTIYLRFAKL